MMGTHGSSNGVVNPLNIYIAHRACASFTGSITVIRPYDFVQGKKKDFLSLGRRKMGIREAMEYLNRWTTVIRIQICRSSNISSRPRSKLRW